MPTRAIDQNPVFAQREVEKRLQDAVPEALHLAVVVFRQPHSIDDKCLQGICHTLVQLSRLGMSCVLVVDAPRDQDCTQLAAVQQAQEQADRFVETIDAFKGHAARRVDGLFGFVDSTQKASSTTRLGGSLHVTFRDLILSPLKKGKIPIVTPIGLDHKQHVNRLVSTDEVVLALTRDLAGLSPVDHVKDDPHIMAHDISQMQKQISLDRIIILDPLGATPSRDRPNGSHVFINLEQEYSHIEKELSETSSGVERHLDNLKLMRNALALLPSKSSGLLTTPEAVAHSEYRPPAQSQGPRVRTRRQRNPLIHNLLTDKPAFSSSLPSARSPNPYRPVSSAMSNIYSSTLIKRGMPVTIFPDPSVHPWTPPLPGSPGISLSDPAIDLPRLVHLIEDSFNRKLDVQHYLSRIENRIAGIIVAGSYEGGALLTWETPPDTQSSKLSPDPSLTINTTTPTTLARPVEEYIPYLDKFAVLRRSQGAGSVADIVFSCMVRDCFPQGVCWRSREGNPVNKWYFERAKGTWKIPGSGWTMFWTTEGVEQPSDGGNLSLPAQADSRGGDSVFERYQSVCRSVVPSWGDGKTILD